MSALVFAKGDAVLANSRDVAAAFEKEHRTVLRSIDHLIAQEPALSAAQFCAAEFRQKGRQSQGHRCFEMNRDGFALLAMGFTGPKALRWKLAYIDAFNRMEMALREAPANDDGPPVIQATPDRFEELKTGLAMVREARATFGREAAKRAWQIAGLPDVTPLPKLTAIEGYGPPHEDVTAWFDDRIEIVEAAHAVRVFELYEDFVGWLAGRGRAHLSMKRFSQSLSSLGAASIKSNGMWKCGVRLRQ